MSNFIPPVFLDALSLADSSWHVILKEGLEAMMLHDPNYLISLAKDIYLPTEGRLFAAFAQPIQDVRFVLVGEGPYPREKSATGVSFMDGAVCNLWSFSVTGGLSKEVNKATSLRNFMKMLLVANGDLDQNKIDSQALAKVALKAKKIGSTWIQRLEELEDNLHQEGFLLLNASLVFRSTVAPVVDARAWFVFLEKVLQGLLTHAKLQSKNPPTLVLWGKIALKLEAVKGIEDFPKAVSEHPYNLSFIQNATMQALFSPMHLLEKRSA
jgi:uracil-DNA glycosylase